MYGHRGGQVVADEAPLRPFACALPNLAVLYLDLGRHDEAEPLAKRAVAILEKSLGAGHPDTVTVMRNYAHLLRRMGREAEAAAVEARAEGAKPQ